MSSADDPVEAVPKVQAEAAEPVLPSVSAEVSPWTKRPWWLLIKEVLPIVANVATALAMMFAAYQITVSLGMQQIASRQAETAAAQAKIAADQAQQRALENRTAFTSTTLKQGLELEHRYNEGRASARDLVVYFYEVYSMDRDNLLIKERATPLLESLRETMGSDPRIRLYWGNENKRWYTADFVNEMNRLLK